VSGLIIGTHHTEGGTTSGMEAGLHIVVRGLVQGVGFRWYAAHRAESLGLRGYVKNCYDGSVEVEAVGDRSLLEEFIKELKVGPRSAHVTDVQMEWLTSSSRQYTSFEIR
jgi:acylphosphatase